MKGTLFTLLVGISIIATIFLSCNKEYSCEGCNNENLPPIAVAGPDQFVTLPTNSVMLDGSLSDDPDGIITKWKWTKISGPASFSILQPDSSKTVINTLVEGVYQVELKVTDDKGTSAKDTVQITVNAFININHPPVACAGPDQTIILPVNSVMLDGSCSTDPNNNITSYTWKKISGPSSFSIINATSAVTQVANLVQGTFLFELKVTDAGGLFSMDTVQVTVNTQNNSLVDIYVSGQGQNERAAYWKNGQEVLLSSSSESIARSIFVVDNNVYAAGEEGDLFMYGNNRAKYWKNGQEVYLTGSTGAGATSITVANGDVYVAGWELGPNSVAKYWKNGVAVSLSNGSTEAWATSIAVVGNDVYVSGADGGDAKYWKNGQAVSLTNGSTNAYASCIRVLDGNVFISGTENGIAKYWKNGQPVSLPNGSIATSIAVVGNDVYVAGWGGNRAIYWKNGQIFYLTSGTNEAYAHSIFVFGGEVYVAGNEREQNTMYAQYWKNGQPVTLGRYVAASIFVVLQ
jgi:hypothetical protein